MCKRKINKLMNDFLQKAFENDLHDKYQRFTLKPVAIIVNNQKTELIDTELNKYFNSLQMLIVSLCCFERITNSIKTQQAIQNLGNTMAYFLKCKDIATKFGVLAPI